MDLVCQGHHLSVRVIERCPLQVYDLGWSGWLHGNGSITMLMVLALGLACQHLELDRQAVEPEQQVEARAMDSAGEAIAGLPVDVVLPDGNLRSLGVTATDGFLQFRSSQLGQHELRAQLPLGGGASGHIVSGRRPTAGLALRPGLYSPRALAALPERAVGAALEKELTNP